MTPPTNPARPDAPLSRRQLLRHTAGLAAGAMAWSAASRAAVAASIEDIPRAATNGRIRQSLVNWCYSKAFGPEELCRVAKKLGCQSVELISPEHWPLLKKHDLVCAIAGSHGFTRGMNDPANHDFCIGKLRTSIDACAEYGFPSVISFTGMRGNLTDEEGLENCVAGFKKVVDHAEKKNVTICLEMLNSRVDETMKGHPGYQGDRTDYCVEIIRRVGSERLKLLFDIYHVQIMEGDVIRRIRQYKDVIGHYHTAGNPGRGELDEDQEIQYVGIMKEIARTGYRGYVGQEFIPTRDPIEGLVQAVKVCDV